MDDQKVGELIYRLRREKQMTQKELAQCLAVSDKAVSKWERGNGLPDVSLFWKNCPNFWDKLEKLLQGNLAENCPDGGNMKKIKFYVCPVCGNILTATGEGEVSCCGRKLTSLCAKIMDEEHKLGIETVENDCYVTFAHEMSKEHFLSFVAYVNYDRVLLIKLYPEQGGEVRFPKTARGKIYFYCTRDGFFVCE